jgi:pilus assembly protein CpaC
MRMTRFLAAAAIGLGAVFSQVAPASAQTLRVLEGATSATLRVPMNRAVVVESDMLFAELSVANPAIADIATLSERSIYILGRAPGRTTMTLLSAEGALIANVEIQVVPDVAELRERLREILPGEGSKSAPPMTASSCRARSARFRRSTAPCNWPNATRRAACRT